MGIGKWTSCSKTVKIANLYSNERALTFPTAAQISSSAVLTSLPTTTYGCYRFVPELGADVASPNFELSPAEYSISKGIRNSILVELRIEKDPYAGMIYNNPTVNRTQSLPNYSGLPKYNYDGGLVMVN